VSLAASTPFKSLGFFSKIRSLRSPTVSELSIVIGNEVSGPIIKTKSFSRRAIEDEGEDEASPDRPFSRSESEFKMVDDFFGAMARVVWRKD